MIHTAESLPDNTALLKEIILQLSQRVASLEEFIRLEKQQRYGASSEKSADQGELFNEAEAIVEACAAQEDVAVETEASDNAVAPKRKPVRKPLPAELPRIRQVYELSLEERHCACGCTLTEIGEEISEQLEVIPAQLRVIQHVRKRYACKGCEENIKTADKPPQLLPKSNASAATLAYAITAKYQDGLPLYRLSNIFQRAGIDLSRQTLSDWVVNTAERLTPVMQLLQQRLHQGPVIHCDETRVQVLHEPNKPPQSNSYMWVQRGGPTDKQVILFHYDSSRSGQVPLRLLNGYHGALMTDGYEGYNAIASQSGITHLCCMVHLRRKFIEAQKALPPNAKSGKIDIALSYIAKLYAIEQQHKESDSTTRHQARQEQSLPLLQQFKAWLDKTQHGVLPKGKLGEALAYAQKYWHKLTRYTENGEWPIDNNPAENAIRPFVIGRKNWLFSNTVKGANASAVLYSLIETAKANQHEPYHYLRWLFTELPKTPEGEIERLMPWSVETMAIRVI